MLIIFVIIMVSHIDQREIVLMGNRNNLFVYSWFVPCNYGTQGIWVGKWSLSRIYIVFSPFDILPVACKKWKDFTGEG